MVIFLFSLFNIAFVSHLSIRGPKGWSDMSEISQLPRVHSKLPGTPAGPVPALFPSVNTQLHDYILNEWGCGERPVGRHDLISGLPFSHREAARAESHLEPHPRWGRQLQGHPRVLSGRPWAQCDLQVDFPAEWSCHISRGISPHCLLEKGWKSNQLHMHCQQPCQQQHLAVSIWGHLSRLLSISAPLDLRALDCWFQEFAFWVVLYEV